MTTDLHTLYRFFDARNRLLYVGITCNPGRRFDRHRSTKDWWPEIARIDMEQHGSRLALRDAERAAITAERPLHNIRMNGGVHRPQRRRRQLDTNERLAVLGDLGDECARCVEVDYRDAVRYPDSFVECGGGIQAHYQCHKCGRWWKCWWGVKIVREYPAVPHASIRDLW